MRNARRKTDVKDARESERALLIEAWLIGVLITVSVAVPLLLWITEKLR